MTAALRGRLARVVAAVAITVTAGACSASRDLARGDFEPQRDGVLVVATALPAPGFWEGTDAATVAAGFEWGLATALADRFGLRLEIVDVPFADLVAGELAGADVAIAQISITDARGEHLDFSVPYYESAPAVLAVDGADVVDLATAKEQRWVVLDGTTEAEFLADTVRPDVDATVVADEAAAVAAVESGAADAALLDLPAALVLAERVEGLDTIARFPATEHFGVALPDGSAHNLQVATRRSGLSTRTARWPSSTSVGCSRPSEGTRPTCRSSASVTVEVGQDDAGDRPCRGGLTWTC